jgi:hypothetical protein
MTDIDTARAGRPPATRVLVILVAACLAQLALIAAFTGAMARPTLHHAEVGLVVADQTPAAAAVADRAARSLHYRDYADAAVASRAVRDGDITAAAVLHGDREELLVAGAAGPALTMAVTQELAAQGKAAGLTVTTADVRPLPKQDPRALGTFLLVLGWVIGGYLGTSLLTRVLGPAARSPRGTAKTLGWLAGYAVISAVAGVVLVGPVMGVVTGSAWALLAAGTLIVFSVAVATAALLSGLGLVGLVVAIAVMVIMGNPTSGGSVPVEMMAPGYRFFAEVLPPNAGVALIRGIDYFGGHQLGRPLLVLGCWAVASVLVLAALAARRSRTVPTGRVPRQARKADRDPIGAA